MIPLLSAQLSILLASRPTASLNTHNTMDLPASMARKVLMCMDSTSSSTVNLEIIIDVHVNCPLASSQSAMLLQSSGHDRPGKIRSPRIPVSWKPLLIAHHICASALACQSMTLLSYYCNIQNSRNGIMGASTGKRCGNIESKRNVGILCLVLRMYVRGLSR